MFNTNRGLFPAYSGLGDIQVELPTPPSRSSIARDVEDLWNIHTSTPHVTAASDPGLSVPYPDDSGFDPRGLSERSNVNTLINRAASPLTTESKDSLLSKLNDLYTERLVSNLQMSNMAPSTIKEMMQNECAGSLLIYNGNDRDSLIKAYTLVKSLEYLVENFVRNSTFSEDAKAEMMTFVSPCPSVRDAMILPEHIIRQRLFGSTESRDHIAHALEIFDLSDDGYTGARGNPLDEDFKDYLEKIDFSELELDRALQKDMVSGDSHAAMYNALNQVLPHIKSADLKNTLIDTVMSVRRKAESQSKKTARSLALLMTKLKRDLENIGVDPRSVDTLIAKEAELREESQSPISTPESSGSVMHGQNGSRSPQEIVKVQDMVSGAISHLKNILKTNTMTEQSRLCCVVEVYTLMCIHDCCSAMMLGADTDACAENLKQAVESELSTSGVPQIKPFKYLVSKAHKDLQSARKFRTMESLNRAKSDSLISDTKLETLKHIIG